MNIKIIKLKQYNSTYKHLLMIDDEPVCLFKSKNRVNDVLGYLQDKDVKISDGKIKKKLDKIMEKGGK